MSLDHEDSPGYTGQRETKRQHQRNMNRWPLDLGFKLEAVTPFLGKYRPFVGRCCQTCTPKSWESVFQKYLPSLGFCNVIKITEENTRYRGWLVRRLCCALAVCEWKISTTNSTDLQERIFQSMRIQNIVFQEMPQGTGDAPVAILCVTQWMRKIQRILCYIQSSLSPFLLRLCHWAMLRFLHLVCLGVIVHKGQMEMVHRAHGVPGVPLVFLSTHKSALDGLLVPLILLSRGLGVLRVMWEGNVNTLRALLTRLGGVFPPPVREQTSNDDDLEEFSRAVVASYIEDLLLSRQPLLIFLEAPFCGALHVSASGKEWLTLVCRAFHSGAVPDITMVPVGIAYDVVPDLIDEGQRPLHLWTLLSLFIRAVRRGLGFIRVDFGQPFSLKEYVENNSFRHNCPEKSLEELLLPEILGKCISSKMECEKSEHWLPGSGDAVANNQKQQTLVDSLSLHTLSAGVSCSAIMAVEILSALLLHKHQEGVFLSRLMQDFVWLTEEIILRNFDVGFSGQVWDVVVHALTLLQCCVTLHRLSLGDVHVAPKRTEAAVVELSRHSAALLPVFIQEAVGGCAINALLVEMLPYLDCPEQLWDVILVQEELHEKAVSLARLLPKDVLLCQPCQSVDCYCQVVVDKLIQCGLLVSEEVPSDRLVCDTAQKGFASKLLWKATDDFSDSDNDYGEKEPGKRGFKVSQLESSSSIFVFLCCLLRPLLKTLGQTVAFLGESECPLPESQYVEKLHQFLARKAKEQCSFECANRTLAAISVHIYKDLGVLTEQPGQPEPILHLSETFAAKEDQEKLEKFILQFVYH